MYMENEIELNEKKVISFGEILIDVTLDESNDDTVKQLRVKFAEIANYLNPVQLMPLAQPSNFRAQSDGLHPPIPPSG